MTGHADGEIRVSQTATGKLVWHKLLAPVKSPTGLIARPSFVTFSGDSRKIVAAGRRDDPVGYDDGIIAVYDAETGATIHEYYRQEVLQAALAADDRMIVIGTSHPQGNDSHLAGIELTTGATRWANPPVSPAHLIQFQSSSPFVSVALKDGHVIRLNALTGREQQRFLTDPSDHEHPNPDPLGRPIFGKGTFNRDGTVFITSVKHSLQLWDVAEGKIDRAMRHRVSRRLALRSCTRRCFAGNRRYRRLCEAKKQQDLAA